MRKIDELKNSLPDGADCAVISSDINRRYFTGMKSSAGTLLVFRDAAYLIVDFRYIEKAQKTVTDCDVILQGRLYEQLLELMKKHGAKTAAIESDTVTVSQLADMKKRLADVEIISDDRLSTVIKNMRIIKTADEIEKIKAAQLIAEKAFDEVLNFIKPGVTEKEIALTLDFYMLRNGAEALSFDTIALSGKNTSLPHGVPSDKKVCGGEFVLMDYGAVVDGYHSDMTRTVCVGSPSEKMTEIYNIVLKAQEESLNGAKSGMEAKQLDKIARDIIASAGYGENFGHSLGHGVGMEIHEAPNASPSSDGILRENMVVTVEPGIYIPDEFGVRIEDFIVIKHENSLNLTSCNKKLICI